MGTVTPITRARFSVGDLVHHRLFGYRGVVVDVDQTFSSSDEWYAAMAKTRPPRNKPWYHVLVDGGTHSTYVAERNLDADEQGLPIDHPLVAEFFTRFENGRYVRDDRVN